MSLAITRKTPDGRAVYNLMRRSQKEFSAQVDFEKSTVNFGGFDLNFNEQDILEIREFSGDKNFDVQVAPPGRESSVWILPPSDGLPTADEASSLEEIDFGEPVMKKDSQRVALQVASSLIGIPFLERMLKQEVPQN